MNNYIIANQTDVGRMRQVNEDSMTTFDSPNGHVVAVCDGMGGQAAGDVASKLACDIIRDILTNNTFPTPQEAITRAMLAANSGILHRSAQNPELQGMGSTCVILLIRDNVVTYGWVGDSRIYLLDDHKLRMLSHDQSYVQSLVDKGEITVIEAENHPQKNEILNALGIEDMLPQEIGVEVVEPGRDMIFMLCSDGLSNMVNEQQIEIVLNNPGFSLQEKAEKLVFLANQYGGPDNITVQLVEFNGLKEAVASPAPIAKKGKKSGGRLLNYIIALVVIVILCAGVFAFFKYKETNSSSNQPPTTTTETSSPQQSSRPSRSHSVDNNKKSGTTTSTTTTTTTTKSTVKSKEKSSTEIVEDAVKDEKKTVQNPGGSGSNGDAEQSLLEQTK